MYKEFFQDKFDNENQVYRPFLRFYHLSVTVPDKISVFQRSS